MFKPLQIKRSSDLVVVTGKYSVLRLIELYNFLGDLQYNNWVLHLEIIRI